MTPYTYPLVCLKHSKYRSMRAASYWSHGIHAKIAIIKQEGFDSVSILLSTSQPCLASQSLTFLTTSQHRLLMKLVRHLIESRFHSTNVTFQSTMLIWPSSISAASRYQNNAHGWLCNCERQCRTKDFSILLVMVIPRNKYDITVLFLKTLTNVLTHLL